MIYEDHTKIYWRDFDFQKKIGFILFWRWQQKIHLCILIDIYIPDYKLRSFWTTFRSQSHFLLILFPFQLYFSILFDFFFLNSFLPTFKSFLPTFKSFLPHRIPFSFELSTFLTLTRSHIIESSYMTMVEKKGVKNFSRWVKN